MVDKPQDVASKSADDKAKVEQRVLTLVEILGHDLNPKRKFRVELDSSLQRDLGFDSLVLAELLMRTEKEFKLRLPDDLFSRLETPCDLAAAVYKHEGVAAFLVTQRADLLSQAVVDTLPRQETTLTGVLKWHAHHNRDRPHILLSDGYGETETITYGELYDAAASVAAALHEWGLESGEFVGIMLPTSREFFEIFFAVLFAGGIPVPMYPPVRLSQLEEHLRRQAGILRNCEAALFIIPEEGKALAGLLGGQIETLRGTATVQDLRKQGMTELSVHCQAEDMAMLQYTSGSTGDPKGVMLTHANLIANIRAMGDAIQATSKDVFVSWLPLYHDLGLIGAWFGSLYYAVPVIVMSPLRFIVRPESWLWAIHRNGATLSAAPNFAFELCVNKIEDDAIEGLDLSSLRMVANGAEPVSAETIQRFTERFQHYGFRPQAMTPVYGLAENAVGLAFSSQDKEPIIDRIRRDAMAQDEMAVPAGVGDANAMSFVSSGVPLPGNQIRIVDTFGREVGARRQGRLEFKGPSSTSGYYRSPQKTKALHRGRWLDSSDLAYIAEGNVFITGRVKDIIIKGGRNIYPQEIEEAVGNLSGIRKGCVAAFASADHRTGSERLIVVAETRSTDPAARTTLEHDVAQTVTDVLGLPADEVIVSPPHTVPKTSSGKVRRSALQELYATGKLGKPVRALWLQILRLSAMSAMTRTRRAFRSLKDIFYAGWWWLVLVVLAGATWVGVLILPRPDLRWKLVRRAAQLSLKLMGIQLTVSGEQRLALDTGVLIANHSSYFDVAVLAAVLPGEPKFIAKKELAGQFIAGPFLRRLGAEFVDRAVGEAGLKDVESYKDLVRQGNRLVVFPEATFFRAPGLLPFRLGAFAIACSTQSLVLPIAINGTRTILRGEQWFPRRGPVRVEVLAPAVPTGRDFAAMVELRDRVRSEILARCGELDMAEAQVVFAKAEDEPSIS